MKLSFNLSAAQTALLSILGSLISACGFLVILPIAHHRDGWTILALFVTMCGLLLLGVYISHMANSSLTDGILNERWKHEGVEKLRAVVLSPWTRALGLALILGLLISMLWWRPFPSHHKFSGWVFYIPAMNLIWLAGAVRPPRSANPQPVWSNLSPIRSEHWGE